jgi:hypothetical protein
VTCGSSRAEPVGRARPRLGPGLLLPASAPAARWIRPWLTRAPHGPLDRHAHPWKRTGPGGPPGLQNRSLPADRGKAGFDSQALPPLPPAMWSRFKSIVENAPRAGLLPLLFLNIRQGSSTFRTRTCSGARRANAPEPRDLRRLPYHQMCSRLLVRPSCGVCTGAPAIWSGCTTALLRFTYVQAGTTRRAGGLDARNRSLHHMQRDPRPRRVGLPRLRRG